MTSTEPLATILIVDDSTELIHALTTLLADKAEILFATTGAAGLELARRRRPDLILLDLQLPDMDGFAVCRALKNDADTAAASVLFVTVSGSDESELAALAAGASDFLIKPLRPAIVRARVETHLTLQRQRLAMHKLAQL
ncbi:MAG TPA: response regulator, partial [Burkholderiaceae bacterium]